MSLEHTTCLQLFSASQLHLKRTTRQKGRRQAKQKQNFVLEYLLFNLALSVCAVLACSGCQLASCVCVHHRVPARLWACRAPRMCRSHGSKARRVTGQSPGVWDAFAVKRDCRAYNAMLSAQVGRGNDEHGVVILCVIIMLERVKKTLLSCSTKTRSSSRMVNGD